MSFTIKVAVSSVQINVTFIYDPRIIFKNFWDTGISASLHNCPVKTEPSFSKCCY